MVSSLPAAVISSLLSLITPVLLARTLISVLLVGTSGVLPPTLGPSLSYNAVFGTVPGVVPIFTLASNTMLPSVLRSTPLITNFKVLLEVSNV